MSARRWDQCGQAIEQFKRGEHQRDAAARARLDALIDEVLRIDFTQPLQRKGRPGAVTQQTLQALAVIRFDAHAGIHREAPGVLPGAHRLRVFALEQSTPGSRTQNTPTHLGLDFGDGFGTDAPGFVKARAARAIGLEDPLDDHAVEVYMGIEQSAKDVDESDCADARGPHPPRECTGASLAPPH